MKKLVKGLIASILLLSISLGAVACKSNKKTDNESGNGSTPIGEVGTVGFNSQVQYQGLHDYTAPEVETDDYIIKNGVFQYKLVFPEVQTVSMQNANKEFYTLIQKATGITNILKTTDSAISSFDENDKYISFGDNSLLEKAGVTYNKAELKQNGGKILTVGKSIFILGGTDTGVLNAVYTFMKICFNYEFFSRNCLTIDTGVKNLKLRNFNVTDVPDIDWVDISANSYSGTYNTPTMIDQYALGETVVEDLQMRKYRLRSVYSEKNLIHFIYGSDHLGTAQDYFHNSMNYLEPRSDTCERKWLADSGRQICYTAHGDAESLERCKRVCANKIIDALIRTPYAKDPEKNYVTLTDEDGGGSCNCAWCLEDAAKYGGAKSGSMVKFCNDVIDMVYEWMDEKDESGNYVNAPYRRPNLRLAFFAYGEMKNAPAYYDETQGKYLPYPDAVPNERVIAWCAVGSSPWNWFEGPNTENNAELKGQWVDAWGDICDLWWYGSTIGDYGYFFMQDFVNGHGNETIQWLASLGTVRAFFYMGGKEVLPRWADVTCYLAAQLCWDSNQDAGMLIEKYFEAMYQDASTTMLKLFNAQRSYYQVLNQRSIQTTGKPMLLQERYWSEEHYPYDVIKGFLDYYYQAIDDIAIHKESDPKLYAVLRDRLDIASLTYYGMLFYIYGEAVSPPFTQEQRAIYKAEALEILKRHPEVYGMEYEDFLGI
ncbi:MAG: DUF4838 domain-containing protein [Clostridiales bacterium]|nr:DUF4838 domain-containing protein [Clostridiales bacterium]